MIAKTTKDTLKEFDPEIRHMEKKTVNFFQEKGAKFGGKDPMFMTVLAYFYIRERLTQQDLQELTGFSAGTVSKILRQLVNINIVTKGTIPGTHKHLYTMNQPSAVFSQLYLPARRILSKYEDELKQMRVYLLTHAREMQGIKDFNEILAAVTLIQRSVHLAFTLIATMKEEAEKCAKETVDSYS